MNKKLIKQWLPRMLVVATLAAAGVADAAEPDSSMMGPGGYGMGPGSGMMDMMGGPGGMGMMGGMGMCPGMGMMGGGMMGGMGMGHGGMGMGGPGMGMMGMGPVGMLDLTDEQRGKIEKIYDDVRRKNWNTYGKIMDEQSKLRDLYSADTVDPKKVGAAYAGISKLHQQIIEANVEAHNSVQAVLTKEQKEQLKQWHRGGMMGGRGMMGPGNMPRGGMGPGMMNR